MQNPRSPLSTVFATCLVVFVVAISRIPAAPKDEDRVHPGFDLTVIRPKGFEPRVTGMEFLPGGRMAVSTWRPNELFILTGYDGPVKGVKVRKAATGFKEIMGLCALGDTLFAADQDRIYALTDKDGDGLPESKSLVGALPFSGSFHEWSFGLVHKDGRFYTGLSVAATQTGRTLAPQKEARRGSIVSMGRDGSVEVVATGLRAPNGMCLGPDSGIFATDNQGSWLPANKFIHIVPGRTYGHQTTPPGEFDEGYPEPPAVWLPYVTVSRSPTQPAYTPSGRYPGQFFFGDIAQGVVNRVFLEKVVGRWQGCVLRFSGGFEAGVHRMLAGPDGSLYLGGLGNGDDQNWGWRAKMFGLQRLKPNGKTVFEIQSVRIRRGGFEVAFSSPPGPKALEPARYEAKQWWYQPTDAYGGTPMDVDPVPVKSVRASKDGMRIFLEMSGLRPQQIAHVRLKDIESKEGKDIWTPDFWYTMNAFSAVEFEP
ncbi:MAG: hypothetical protein M3Y08_01935 [Fibrobacterota bacterium]|nr:hypothetical protein [Fibrobacterota bacterium]